MRKGLLALVVLGGLALGVWLVGRDGRRAAEPNVAPPAARATARERPELVVARAEASPSESAPHVAAVREELAADETATAAESDGPARIVGQLVPAPGLVFDEEHPLGQTMLIWSVLPRADEAEAPGFELHRLLDFSDDEGRFELADAPVGHELELTLKPPLGPEQVHHVSSLANGELRRLEFRLDPGATIRGRLVDEIGNPIHDARIQLEDLRRSDLRTLEGDELARTSWTQAGIDGRFEFLGLPRCQWLLQVWGLSQATPALEVDTTSGDAVNVEITAHPGAELEVLTRLPDGSQVDCGLQFSPDTGDVQRLDTGLYRLVGIEPRLTFVRATGTSAGKPVRGIAHAVEAAGQRIEILLRSVEPVDRERLATDSQVRGPNPVRLQEGSSELVGRLEDALGRPVSKARLTIRIGGGSRTDFSNARGEFLSPRLPAGAALLTAFDQSTGAFLRRTIELRADARTCIELRFEPLDRAQAAGRISFDGQPAAGALRLEGQRGLLELELDSLGRFQGYLPAPGTYSGTFRLFADGLARRLELDVPTHTELEFRVEDLPLAD